MYIYIYTHIHNVKTNASTILKQQTLCLQAAGNFFRKVRIGHRIPRSIDYPSFTLDFSVVFPRTV